MSEIAVDLNARVRGGELLRGRCYGLCSVGDRIRLIDEVAEVRAWGVVRAVRDWGGVHVEVDWDSIEPLAVR